ncbi:MAG: sortase [Patescibacteria group bacterium]
MLAQKQPHLKSAKFIITALLVLLASIVGYFVFRDWQARPETVAGNISIVTTSTNTAAAPVHRVPLKTGEPNRITIPDRDIQAPVIYVDNTSEEVFQEALGNGVVHYPGTPEPGELGNPYIFGHSSDYAWKPGDYKKIFTPLVDIPIGTAIHITNSVGELYVYTVSETKVVGPKDVSVLDQYDFKRYMLTLQTSYPIGTALKRFIAIAELDEMATYGPTTDTREIPASE